jgi:2-iminobutanoate/2-iminopropanoate deaminase
MAPDRTVVDASDAPAAVGPYSHAIRTGDLLFCSMQIPLDPKTGEISGATPAEQTAVCLRNLGAIAAAAGGSLAGAVRLTVYVTDMGAFAEVNEAYAEFFESAPPARAAIGVAALPRGAQVAADAVIALS